MTITGAIAALFLKRASKFKTLVELFKDINLYAGAGLYLFGTVINIYLLNFIDLSIIMPLTSITYIWTMLLSYFILKEKITKNKIIGVVGISIGAILIIL